MDSATPYGIDFPSNDHPLHCCWEVCHYCGMLRMTQYVFGLYTYTYNWADYGRTPQPHYITSSLRLPTREPRCERAPAVRYVNEFVRPQLSLL